MVSLNAEPAGQVRTMEEFFAVAHAIETDAAARYDEASRLLRAEGFEQIAAVFEHLAGLERAHVGQVEQWASRKDMRAISHEPWPIPDTFDAPPEEVARSRLMTPYRVLASAVRHEQRAFAFWTYVAAHADSEDVRQASEKMALEELEHASLLRRERRNAYRLAKAHPGEEDAEHLPHITRVDGAAPGQRSRKRPCWRRLDDFRQDTRSKVEDSRRKTSDPRSGSRDEVEHPHPSARASGRCDGSL